jgi:Zn-dependent protease
MLRYLFNLWVWNTFADQESSDLLNHPGDTLLWFFAFVSSDLFSHPGDILLWFIVFLFSLSCHESAHAWTSERFGDYTGRYQGRITLNPIPHIDIFGTIIFPLVAILSPGGAMLFGWAKPVQTNPLLWRDKKKANIMVSMAGPASNFILAIIAFAIIKILLISAVVGPATGPDAGRFDIVLPTANQPGILIPIAKLLSILLELNVVLGVFNLVPVPPLDGSHVLESLLPYEMSQAYSAIRPYGIFLLVGLMLLGVFDFIIRPVFDFVFMLLFGG